MATASLDPGVSDPIPVLVADTGPETPERAIRSRVIRSNVACNDGAFEGLGFLIKSDLLAPAGANLPLTPEGAAPEGRLGRGDGGREAGGGAARGVRRGGGGAGGRAGGRDAGRDAKREDKRGGATRAGGCHLFTGDLAAVDRLLLVLLGSIPSPDATICLSASKRSITGCGSGGFALVFVAVSTALGVVFCLALLVTARAVAVFLVTDFCAVGFLLATDVAAAFLAAALVVAVLPVVVLAVVAFLVTAFAVAFLTGAVFLTVAFVAVALFLVAAFVAVVFWGVAFFVVVLLGVAFLAFTVLLALDVVLVRVVVAAALLAFLCVDLRATFFPPACLLLVSLLAGVALVRLPVAFEPVALRVPAFAVVAVLLTFLAVFWAFLAVLFVVPLLARAFEVAPVVPVEVDAAFERPFAFAVVFGWAWRPELPLAFLAAAFFRVTFFVVAAFWALFFFAVALEVLEARVALLGDFLAFVATVLRPSFLHSVIFTWIPAQGRPSGEYDRVKERGSEYRGNKSKKVAQERDARLQDF